MTGEIGQYQLPTGQMMLAPVEDEQPEGDAWVTGTPVRVRQ